MPMAQVACTLAPQPSPHVATHCLFEAVVALVAGTRGLKAILLEDGSDEGASVCSEEK